MPPARQAFRTVGHSARFAASKATRPSETVPSLAGNKPTWRGPFQTIETACLAIARSLAVENADRRTRSIEAHRIPEGALLYGLKPTTKL